MSIQLEVGKRYATRDGRHYQITKHEMWSLYPFVGQCVSLNLIGEDDVGRIDSFTPDGRFNKVETTKLDLIREVGGEDPLDTGCEQMDKQPGPPEAADSSSVLLEAEGIVNGARQGQYGKAENSFYRIARLWNTYLNVKYEHPDDRSIDSEDVANLMILLKMARQMHSPKRDNYVDIAGYAELANRIVDAYGKQS